MSTALSITLGAIVLLLLLSAIFSGSETALTTASQARMHHLKRKGNRRAGIVSALNDRRERLLGTILLGNNLVNILASALATSVMIGWLGDPGVAYATVVMTLLILIFSEILPKTYAILNADRTALALAPFIRALVVLLGPGTVLDILLTGDLMDAGNAARAGLVSRVVPDGEVVAAGFDLARRIAAGAPLVNRWHKQFIRRLADPRPMSDAEKDEALEAFGTADYREGRTAFLEKRDPDFRGE